ATSEPYRYETLESGAITTAFQLVHDAGWTSYPQNLAINRLRLDALRPCLTKLVPMMQQAQINFVASPDRTIATIGDVVTQLDTSWQQSPELAAYAIATMKSLGIVGNGTTPTFGDFESPRIDDFITRAIPILRGQGLEISDMTAADLATNEFINPAISLP
ncbi:MAG: ABC transporter substrate-binding protein, partial [Acidimicrobiaceae bacterium]|nr:ABC transporter substrate-binding protein [Acidimicrobiaceae bacterium]